MSTLSITVEEIFKEMPANLNAAEPMKPMKGSEHLIMLNEIKSTKDLNALKTDDSIAMVCAKCKTVWVTRVKQGVKGAQLLMENGQPTELIGTHACAGCNSTLTVVGHAKGDPTPAGATTCPIPTPGNAPATTAANNTPANRIFAITNSSA